MTYQIVQTMPSASAENDKAAITYFMDTFLPARGWTVGSHPSLSNTSNDTRWILQRNFTDLFTNTPEKSYLWVSYAHSSTGSHYFSQYEDATYTTVPGDKGTDSTNRLDLAWTPNVGATQFPWKFWVSSENNKAFLVTRYDVIYFWDYGCDFPVYRTWPANEVPNLDRKFTCNWLPMKGYTPTTNLPNSYGNNTTEYALKFVVPGHIENLEGPYLLSPITMKQDGTMSFFWDQPDVSMYCPDSSVNSTNRSTIIAVISNIYPVQFNGIGDYHLLTKNTPTSESIAFNIGPTLPDLIGA